MAATVGTNILCTTLIVARILYNARRHCGIMDGIRTYRGVLEIVVESAALHSIIFVALVICYPIEGNGYMYPQALMYPVTVRPFSSIYLFFCLNKHLGYCPYSDYPPGYLGTRPSQRVFA